VRKIKIGEFTFAPFSDILAEKLKNKRFKKAYTEEISRLQLAYEIKMLRQKKGLTQKQVAAKAKMPQSVVARLESGSRGFSIATLYKVAAVFDRRIGLIIPRRQ
jgi:DNA-binding XRE family transcriptional regulator